MLGFNGISLLAFPVRICCSGAATRLRCRIHSQRAMTVPTVVMDKAIVVTASSFTIFACWLPLTSVFEPSWIFAVTDLLRGAGDCSEVMKEGYLIFALKKH